MADPNLTEILKAKEAGTDTPLPVDTTRTGHGVETTHPPLEPTKGERWSLWRDFEEEQGSFSTFQLYSSAQQVQGADCHGATCWYHGRTFSGGQTHSKLKELFYWPGYWKDVQLYCQACTSCATQKTPAPKGRAPLQHIRAGHPLEIVVLDLTGPFLEGPSGNRYILVVGDYFTKWMAAYAVPDQEATTIAQKTC